MNSKEKENLGEEELAAENQQETQEEAQENSECSREEELSKQLEDAHAKIEEQDDKYLRLSAEFDNYRKRTMKEKAELIRNGGERAIESFLPVADDLERAIKMMRTSDDAKAIKEGVELIYSKFMTTLSKNGVQVIETTDKEFNTDYHEAIALVPAPVEELKGKILDCVQTGYLLNDKVIRHAKVVVGE